MTTDHVHDHWGVAVPLSGLVMGMVPGKRAMAAPGEVLCIEPGHRHRNGCGPQGCRHLLVQVVDPERVFPHGREVAGSGARRLSLEGAEIARGLARLSRQSGHPKAIQESALLLLSSMDPRGDVSSAPPWLGRVRARVVEDPRSPPDLDELASIADVHPSTVLRRYRARYGATPSEFNRRWRLEEAALRLRESSTPLARIAAELGFADQSHLTRLFRRRFGITPGAYRARHRRPGT